MMIKLIGFSFASGLLSISLAMYFGLGLVLIVASYLAGSMAATCATVYVNVARQERGAGAHGTAKCDQDIQTLKPAL
ncbi:MAG: hypothetical protein AAGL23_14225 [Pseudomonadota bacterium]